MDAVEIALPSTGTKTKENLIMIIIDDCTLGSQLDDEIHKINSILVGSKSLKNSKKRDKRVVELEHSME